MRCPLSFTRASALGFPVVCHLLFIAFALTLTRCHHFSVPQHELAEGQRNLMAGQKRLAEQQAKLVSLMKN